MGKGPNIPNPAAASVAGIKADQELQPYNYLINAASTLGAPVTIDGKTYDFTGLGQADVTGKISDQMAQTLLDLQKENDPIIIQQRLDELKAADPQGYAARQQLFDAIQADASSNPGRPINTDLQQQLQDNLAKGAGFDDAREEQQVRDTARGSQVMRGLYLGNAAASDEAKQVVGAGEGLRNQRQQDALNLLNSGASPEDVAYRKMQQTLSNEAAFANGQTPEAQFRQVSGASNPTVSLTGGAPNTNTFNPNAAGQGLNNALGIYSGMSGYNATQANPWLSGLSLGGAAFGGLAQANPSWFGGNSPIYNGYSPGGGQGYATGTPGQQE